MTTLVHTYLTRCKTLELPPGLGDFLRGSIALAHHARERGWHYRLDFSGHPIGRFLEPSSPIGDAGDSGDEVAEFFDAQATGVYAWMDGLRSGDIGRVCTNLLPHPSRIDADIARLIRAEMPLRHDIQAAAGQLHQRVSGGADFAIVHARVSDADARSRLGVAPALVRAMADEVQPRWGRRVAVLSNNTHVRQHLCREFGLEDVGGAAVHLGACDAGDEAVRDTLVDFALILRASQVYSYSSYHWPSGFSHWASVIGDRPFLSLKRVPDATGWTNLKRQLKTWWWRFEA